MTMLLRGGLLIAAAALAACSGGETQTSTGVGGTTSGTGASGGTVTGGTGGTGGDTTGTGGTGGGPFMPGPHPKPPTVITFGGKVLKTPKVLPILYSEDANAADMEKAIAEMAAGTFWEETTKEYGVGPLSVLPTVHPAGPAPATQKDSDLTAMLTQNLTGANPAWGKADPETIYMFVLPEGAAVDADGLCCDTYYGYHDEAIVGGVHVPYAISCTCKPSPKDPVSELDETTGTVAHELVEAATDPLPQSDTAYGQTDDDNAVWTMVSGGETADMCALSYDQLLVPKGMKYAIQRSWSNASAAAGKNPCLPFQSTDPYVNSAPVLLDTVTVDYFGPWTTKGVKIAEGQSATIDVQLWSEAETSGPWKVTAYDYNAEFNGGSPLLELSLDKDMGSNGDTLKLTIKVLKADKVLGGEIFFLQSDFGEQSNVWFGIVGN